MKLFNRTNIGSLMYSGTQGSVLYIDANGKLAQDNSNFFWDYTSNRLGILTNTPSKTFHINTAIGDIAFDSSTAMGNSVGIFMEDSGGNLDEVLTRYIPTNDVYIGDIEANGGGVIIAANGMSAIIIDSSKNVGIDTTPSYKFEINGTAGNGYFGITNSVAGDIVDIDSNGNITIGNRLNVNGTAQDSSDGAIQVITGNLTSATNSQNGILINSVINPASSSTKTYTGVKSLPVLNSTNLSGGSVAGMLGGGIITGSGNLANLFGFNLGSAHIGTGTVTNVFGAYVANPATYSSGTFTNNYGLFIGNMTIGTSLNYAIYSVGGQSYHAGKFGFGVTTPTAKINIAAGSATANTGPLKFTSGTLLTVPEAGVWEYLSNLFYLRGGDGLRIGDSSNYINFANDGTLTLAGTARVLKEMRIEGINSTLGASSPTSTRLAVGASGSVEKPVLSFSNVTSQETYMEFHTPSDCDLTTDVIFSIMWKPGNGWTSGNYVWKFEYLVLDEDGAYNTGTPTTITLDVTPANATNFREDNFTSTITLSTDAVLVGRFYRDTATDTGDDVGLINYFEIEYTSNKLGE